MIGKAMTLRLGQYVQRFLAVAAVAVVAACLAPPEAKAAPYAAYVMDARTGETLYSENADTRLHPASLTKMMTLYIAFEEIERGRLSLDTMVTVSKNAAFASGAEGGAEDPVALSDSRRGGEIGQ